MKMEVGKGLKAVARKEFEQKVRNLACPQLQTASYPIVNGKIHGVPVQAILDIVIANRLSYMQTADRLNIARR